MEDNSFANIRKINKAIEIFDIRMEYTSICLNQSPRVNSSFQEAPFNPPIHASFDTCDGKLDIPKIETRNSVSIICSTCGTKVNGPHHSDIFPLKIGDSSKVMFTSWNDILVFYERYVGHTIESMNNDTISNQLDQTIYFNGEYISVRQAFDQLEQIRLNYDEQLNRLNNLIHEIRSEYQALAQDPMKLLRDKMLRE